MYSQLTARNVLKYCMDLKKNERFLIVSDPNKLDMADIFLKEAERITKNSAIILSKPALENGQEPNRIIGDAMRLADVAIFATTRSFSHTDARRDAIKKGVRIASMPGITYNMLNSGGLTADYRIVKKITERVGQLFKDAEEVRVTTKNGTDIIMDVTNRKIFLDTGVYRKRGEWGNLPAGEVCMAPVEGTTNGTLIVDGSIMEKLTKPIEIKIKDGRIVEMSSGALEEKLRKAFKRTGKNSMQVAEFGIGTNPKAISRGIVLEDEKVLGTAHLAFGNNKSFGGKLDFKIHIDGVFKRPTIWIDNKKIMSDGVLI